MASLLENLLRVVVLGVLALFFYLALGGWGLLAVIVLIAAAVPLHLRWLEKTGQMKSRP
ncbi:MAG: hypothetical protein RBS40_02580 [Rhodocyclaceae bacterium]|jgi:hypothetical protein|nr:hypothetical protein [Rhodocyclaceae bacterium]